MRCHDIFHTMTPAMAAEILDFLLTEQKEVYHAAVDNLAPQQKLRTLFVYRKPKADRHKWLAGALARKQNEQIAGNLLQLWLTAAHKEMLITFLDSLGVTHDGDGMVEDMPPAPAAEILSPAVDALLVKYPPAVVGVYLRTFLGSGLDGWESLEKIVAEDPRLQSGAVA